MKKVLAALSAAVLLLLAGGGYFFYEHPMRAVLEQTRFRLWRAGVRSEYVDVGMYRLHYFEALPPAGSPDHPLVMIHGLGSKGEDWGALIPGLAARGFHVYVPDLLGYGRSPQPDVDYSIALQEKTVDAFMQAVHLDRADVGGWSMGGWVAMKLAVEDKKRVDRLLVYDSAGTYFQATFQPDLFVPKDVDGLNRLLAALSPHPRALPGFVARDALRDLQRNSWVVNRSTAAMVSGRDLMDFRLHEIRQPMLIVWGSHDDLIPLTTGEAIHRGVPQSVLAVIDGCGHMAPLECVAPVEKATVDFLKAEPAPSGGELVLKP